MGNDAVDACDECKRNCLLIHAKKNRTSSLSPSPLSFFKLMIGDNFSNYLYLPPKFGREVVNLIGQKVFLEDSNGRQWGVTISKLNGSLAFKQGWKAFTLDHDLKFGEFVIFHYVKGSHFIVQIYDKTGCTKDNFPEDKSPPKKRLKTNNNCAALTNDKSSMNKQDSSGSAISRSDIGIYKSPCNVRKVDEVDVTTKKDASICMNSNGASLPVVRTDCMDESYYMTINRDLSSKPEEVISPIYDLSDFEMRCNISAADQCNEGLAGKGTSSVQGCKLPETRAKAGSTAKHPVIVENWRVRRPSNVSKFQTNEKNDAIRAKPKVSSRCEDSSCSLPRKNTVVGAKMSNSVIKSCQIPEQKNSIYTGPIFGNGQVNLSQKKQTPDRGKRLLTVKQERPEVTQGNCSLGELTKGKEPNGMKQAQSQTSNPMKKDSYNPLQVVKSEASDTPELLSPGTKSVSCLVPSINQSYLELPTALPWHEGKVKFDEKVVRLKDPVMRLWPVLYHNRYDCQVLSSGWEAFRKANSIQLGDECVFELENAREGIFTVRVIRRF